MLAEKQKKEGENLGFCPGSVPDRVETSARGGLANWPVQIKLVSSSIAFPAGTHLLIAADCTAYACGNFHDRFINGRVTLIGCPKLDGVDYSEKLAQILFHNDIASLTVVRMTVPCCGGLEHAVKKTLMICGKVIPLSVVTISADGKVTEG